MAVKLDKFAISFPEGDGVDEDKADWSPTKAVVDAFLDAVKAFARVFRSEIDEYVVDAPNTVVFEADLGFLPRWIRWLPFLRRIKVTVKMIDEFIDGVLPGDK